MSVHRKTVLDKSNNLQLNLSQLTGSLIELFHIQKLFAVVFFVVFFWWLFGLVHLFGEFWGFWGFLVDWFFFVALFWFVLGFCFVVVCLLILGWFGFLLFFFNFFRIFFFSRDYYCCTPVQPPQGTLWQKTDWQQGPVLPTLHAQSPSGLSISWESYTETSNRDPLPLAPSSRAVSSDQGFTENASGGFGSWSGRGWDHEAVAWELSKPPCICSLFVLKHFGPVPCFRAWCLSQITIKNFLI